MNILDAISYGMITFPTSVPAFANFGGIGVSMFFVSCLVAQLVFSGGGSIFAAGNGSMMIEVVVRLARPSSLTRCRADDSPCPLPRSPSTTRSLVFSRTTSTTTRLS